MSVDAALEALPHILEKLERIENELAEIKARQADTHEPTSYDAKALQARGYGRDNAYALLRAKGKVISGKKRITHAALVEYEESVPAN